MTSDMGRGSLLCPLNFSGLLDQKSLTACAAVSRYWAFLVKEVEREHVCQGLVQEKIRYLQVWCLDFCHYYTLIFFFAVVA